MTEQSPPSAQPPGAPPSPAAPPGAVQMPQGLPTQYWDATKGALNTDTLVKDFIAAQPVLTRHAARPEKPELYKAELPEDFTKALPEGVEVKFDPKDPVRGPILAEAQKLAHEIGVDQPTFSRLLALQGQLEVKQMQAFHVAETARIEADIKALGENYPKRAEAVVNFVKAAVTGDDKTKTEKAAALADIVDRGGKAAFEALEDLMARATASSIPGGSPPAPPPPKPADIPIEQRWYGPGSQQKAS